MKKKEKFKNIGYRMCPISSPLPPLPRAGLFIYLFIWLDLLLHYNRLNAF